MRSVCWLLLPALAACSGYSGGNTPGYGGSLPGALLDGGATGDAGPADAGGPLLDGGYADAGAFLDGGYPDGGAFADAGLPDGGADAGATFADAGPSAGGLADAGMGAFDAGLGFGGASDAGPPGADCAGLMPTAQPMPVSHQAIYSTAGGLAYCGLPTADGQGVVSFEQSGSDHPSFTLLSPAGATQGSLSLWHGSLWPQPAGFIADSGSSTEQTVAVTAFDEHGHALSGTPVQGAGIYTPDLLGGLLLTGQFALGNEPPQPASGLALFMFNTDASVRYGPIPLGASASLFGAGIDLFDRALVIFDGSGLFGAGAVGAAWFDTSGAPLTGPFRLLSGFVAGTSTWFETSPLLGGGIAVRRMDSGPGDVRTSQWLVTVPSGLAQPGPAPAWLTARPDTNLSIVRGGLAYATTPWSANESPCAQRVEVLSPAGNSCGALEYAVDDGSCTTRELRLGLDGTVLQMLPADRETTPAGTDLRSCTLRFWPAALR